MKLHKALNEDGEGGATTSGAVTSGSSVAGVRNPLFAKKRLIKRAVSVVPKKLKEHKMDFIRSLLETPDQEDTRGPESKIKSALKAAGDVTQEDRNAAGFVFQDSNGKKVTVFVKREQAEDFERAMAREAYNEDGKEISIPELLTKLRRNFDILKAEWDEGSIPKSEENEEVDMDAESGEGDALPDEGETDPDLDDLTDDEQEMDAGESLDDSLAGFESDETDVQSTLDKVIDMMKSDAQAKEAEAKARQAAAEAELARTSLKSAEYRAAQEEEILDMEQFNKQQAEKKKMADTTDKIKKYRFDSKHIGESMDRVEITPEEEEVFLARKHAEKKKLAKNKQKEKELVKDYKLEKKHTASENEEVVEPRQKFSFAQTMESFGAGVDFTKVSFKEFLTKVTK